MPGKGNVVAGSKLEAKKRPGLRRRLVLRMDAAFYPDYVLRWDDFFCRDQILGYLGRGKTVLDLGAGSGIYPHTNFRGFADRVYGVDPSPSVIDNPNVDEARIACAEDLPFESSSFDVVFAWNVLEHLAKPELAFAEVSRVLKPGGVFVVKTPNSRHYVGLIGRLTPHWFHVLVITRLLGWRRQEDVFPTFYRANSIRMMQRLAEESGLSIDKITAIETRPEYLRFNPLVYPFGILYERIVNARDELKTFRAVLVTVFRKPAVTKEL